MFCQSRRLREVRLADIDLATKVLTRSGYTRICQSWLDRRDSGIWDWGNNSQKPHNPDWGCSIKFYFDTAIQNLAKLYFCFTIQLEVFSRGSDSCFCQGSRLLLVHRRKFGWSSTLFFKWVQLFIVEAFSHCLTIIFNQFNESWYPVRPFYRLVSFKSTLVYSPRKFLLQILGIMRMLHITAFLSICWP